MSSPEDNQNLPYNERSIPEIAVLASFYFGPKVVAYALEDDEELVKLEAFQDGSAEPDKNDELRLRNIAEIMQCAEDRHISQFVTKSVMSGANRVLDERSAWDLIRNGESQRVVEVMPALLQPFAQKS